jgi:hypothetical protein
LGVKGTTRIKMLFKENLTCEACISALTLIWMAIKKCVAVRLGVIYDSKATNRKQGVLPVIAPLLPAIFLLVAWETYMTPSWSEYTKTPSKTAGSYNFLIEKSPKTVFCKNLKQDIILTHFVRNRSRRTNIFT